MFGIFGKKTDSRSGDTVSPSADWDPKSSVLTLVDRSGRKTTRKNPFPVSMAEHDVVKVEIIRDEVRFTLHPKPQRNKDGRNKPRSVVLDLRGKLVGGRIL